MASISAACAGTSRRRQEPGSAAAAWPGAAGSSDVHRGGQEVRDGGGRVGGLADHVLIAEGDQLVGGQLAAQPRHLAHRAAPAHRALGGHGQPRPGGPVGLGLQAQQRVRELGVDVHEARPEPGEHGRVGQHPGHRIPAVPDDLQDPRVRERVEQRLGAVHQVRAGVPVADDPLLAHARPDAVQAASLTALLGAAQAAVGGDLPGLGERVPQHGRRGLGLAPGDRRPPGEGLHHRDDPALAQREVEARRTASAPGPAGRCRSTGHR